MCKKGSSKYKKYERKTFMKKYKSSLHLEIVIDDMKNYFIINVAAMHCNDIPLKNYLWYL